MDFFGNQSILTSHANNILLHSISSSTQDLNYPLLDSMTSSLLNGTNVINPAMCTNASFLSASVPDLSNGKHKAPNLQNSPDATAVQIKYEPHTPRCTSKSSEDAEGVWSPDIEMAFQEALRAYPPCGRRKIILTDEGKMYGRNELIARYIKDKTGKSRTRKQVSSHIQVLARKKSKEVQQQIKVRLQDSDTRQKLLEHYSNMSSAQIVNESIKEKKMRRSNEIEPSSPSNHIYYPKSETTIKTEVKTSPNHIPCTTAVTSSTGMLPFIKTEDAKYRTQSSPNLSYLPSPLQSVAFPRTLSSLVDSTSTVDTHPSSTITTDSRPHPSVAMPPHSDLRLKMLKFHGYMEATDRSWRHFFIDLNTDTEFNDPNLLTIDIEKIYDKFREFPNGDKSLKELFYEGPPSSFFVVKFWVNLNMPPVEDPKSCDIFHGHDNAFESKEKLHIQVSTKACSFGKGVVTKVQKIRPIAEDGRLIYRDEKSPLCEYMVNFIHKLKGLPATNLMDNVLENFTVLQHITDADTSETLFCIACMFEVSKNSQSSYSIFKLVGN